MKDNDAIQNHRLQLAVLTNRRLRTKIVNKNGEVNNEEEDLNLSEELETQAVYEYEND